MPRRWRCANKAALRCVSARIYSRRRAGAGQPGAASGPGCRPAAGSGVAGARIALGSSAPRPRARMSPEPPPSPPISPPSPGRSSSAPTRRSARRRSTASRPPASAAAARRRRPPAAPAAAPARPARRRPRRRPSWRRPAAISRRCARRWTASRARALRQGARNLVFADGDPAARLMVIGEAPGREEDRERAALRRAARASSSTGCSRRSGCRGGRRIRAAGAYITNVLPWRPPQNRDPSGDEAAKMLPFLFRHIELARAGGPAPARLAGGARRARHRATASPGCAAAGTTGAGCR